MQKGQKLSREDTPHSVCVWSKSRKSGDLNALGSREVMVVMKVGIVATVVVSE